jgi:predicted nucleic-acid-binding protein
LTGIDTNVLTRFIMQDDRSQSQAASRFLESLTPENPGFIALVTVAELGWVLMRRYKLSRRQFAEALDSLFGSTQVVIENASLVADAFLLFEQTNADFSDCLVSLSAKSAGCDAVATFDVRAAKLLAINLLK